MQTDTAPTDAIVLAAGNGSRLVQRGSSPKPLATVGGRALLDHVLCGLETAGFRRVVVVVGYGADLIRGHAFSPRRLTIEWILNPQYTGANGLSLLCARATMRVPFALLMADHLFEVTTLKALRQQACPTSGCVLAVDRRIDRVFDLADATKIASNGHRLSKIGKHLSSYDAVDTGMFLCDPAIFRAMAESVDTGETELSAGVRHLADHGSVHLWDIGDASWIDVDTPSALREAERLMRAGCFRQMCAAT